MSDRCFVSVAILVVFISTIAPAPFSRAACSWLPEGSGSNEAAGQEDVIGFFSLAQRVKARGPLTVRRGPGLGYTVLDTVRVESMGTIVMSRPALTDNIWWQVMWDTGLRGWSYQRGLEGTDW